MRVLHPWHRLFPPIMFSLFSENYRISHTIVLVQVCKMKSIVCMSTTVSLTVQGHSKNYSSVGNKTESCVTQMRWKGWDCGQMQTTNRVRGWCSLSLLTKQELFTLSAQAERYGRPNFTQLTSVTLISSMLCRSDRPASSQLPGC